MAKAPGTADTFDGSGQVWFKILDIGPTFDSSGTATWNLLRKQTHPKFIDENHLMIEFE